MATNNPELSTPEGNSAEEVVKEKVTIDTPRVDVPKEKLDALKIAMERIQKTYGKGSIMNMVDNNPEPVSVIPTGSIGLDLALGVGGYPRGRIVEIFGPESSGKTTLAIHAIAEAQKLGGLATIVDAEHAFDPAYAQHLGVQLDRLYISQPDNGEQALEIAEQVIRSSAMDIVVIDSVAALTPKQEIEGEMGEKNVGLQARLMSQALRKMTAAVSKSNTVCIFINQLRDKIGVMYGNPETTTGGNALKFYSSVRLDTAEACSLRDGVELLADKGYRVIGVSRDSKNSHLRFKEKHQLPFPLIADTEQILHRAMNVLYPKKMFGKEVVGTRRTTFFINKEGIIVAKLEGKEIDTAGHALQIVETLKNIPQ